MFKVQETRHSSECAPGSLDCLSFSPSCHLGWTKKQFALFSASVYIMCNVNNDSVSHSLLLYWVDFMVIILSLFVVCISVFLYCLLCCIYQVSLECLRRFNFIQIQVYNSLMTLISISTYFFKSYFFFLFLATLSGSFSTT